MAKAPTPVYLPQGGKGKQIQTPLISDGFIKSLGWKRFIVSSDSLARLIWRGDDLTCIPVLPNNLPKVDDLVVVECRIAGRKYCSYRVGWFLSADGQSLTLTYDHPRLKEEIVNWTVPLGQIKRIYEVDRISRDYARVRKFYP